jgi:hypothetical protein
MFSKQLPGDARYIAPESMFAGGWTGMPKPTKEGDMYSYGCVAILVRHVAHQPYMHFHRDSPGIVRKGAVLVDFGRESSTVRKRKGHMAFSSYYGGMILRSFSYADLKGLFIQRSTKCT